MESKELIQILKEVPESHLRLIQIAGEVIDGKGDIDPEKLILLRKEVEEAADEAEGYIRATREALSCLMNLAR